MIGIRRTSWIVARLLLPALLGFFATSLMAEKLEDLPAPTGYVSDYAHVLSPQAIARLDNLCAQLDHSQANAQIAVVTIHTLDGDDSADYATRLFEKMKIGAKGTDRGILLMLAVDDHKRSIKVGYGLEGILPDGKTGDIGREMVPALRSNDFDGAVTLGVDEIAQVIAADAKVTLNEEEGVPAPRQARHGAGIGKIILIVIVLIFFAGFHLLRFLFGFGWFSSWRGGPWIGGGGFGGGGGGFGGGDSGGGGGFGGFGGGGTGGGGSDGSW